ncbi:hypothetical protein, partial [Klebsiella pneumoniae]|uniref:hypothetical protein n=1 Tax=Klebsiella pneumoniae TaxID=573 RepID=UPI001CD25D42
LERWIKGSAILGCVGCLVGHLFMFLVGGKTPDQSVHLNLTTTVLSSRLSLFVWGFLVCYNLLFASVNGW